MDAQDIEAKLNQFSPSDVREAFHGIDKHPLRGLETSERGFTGPVDAGNSKPGVRIVAALGKVFVRVTVAEGGAAAFTEYEMTPASFQGLAAALLSRLGAGVITACLLFALVTAGCAERERLQPQEAAAPPAAVTQNPTTSIRQDLVMADMLTRTFQIRLKGRPEFGTAFIADVKGRQYLITADHVLSGSTGSFAIEVARNGGWGKRQPRLSERRSQRPMLPSLLWTDC
jgi:hypothetical protein